MNDTTLLNRNEQATGDAGRSDMAARQGEALNGGESTTGTQDRRRSDAALMPAVDVIEDPTGITLLADLPGVPKDKLNVQVESDMLTIEGEVSFAMPESMEASHAEISIPRFRRTFALSRELDTAKVEAEFQNGVLRLRIPKAEHAQPRRIQINAR